MINNKRKIIYYLTLSIFITLSGCVAKKPPPEPRVVSGGTGVATGAVVATQLIPNLSSPIGVVAGGIMGGAIGVYFQKHQTQVERLQAAGIKMVEVGDDIKLILPSGLFFISNTPRLQPSYYPVLNDLADFLGKIPKITIIVTAYTDNQDYGVRSLGLTREQAQNLVQYLWERDVDARFIIAAGHGAAYPIASNTTIKGRTMNRRIEITLRRIHV